MVFMYVKEKTLGQNYKEAYELWREIEIQLREKIWLKIFVKQVELDL